MAKLMCFRPAKRSEKNDGIYDMAEKEDTNANVAPAARMSREPVQEGLLLQYITSRLLVLTSPDDGTESAYLDSLQTAILTLKAKHFLHYKVWSVSRKRIDISRQLNAEDCGWPAGLVSPLDRLCAICKQLEQWLQQDPTNVAVIHCKGDRSRAAMIISAFMHYNVICSNDDSIEDRFNMQRYADTYIGGFCQPSHRRYISYFTNLLSGKLRVNSTPLYLHRVSLSHFQGNTLSLKIYERLRPVYETLPKSVKKESKWDIEGELSVRGDILLKCQLHKDGNRKDFFLCQINTCALSFDGRSLSITFHKEELDLIFADPSVDNRAVLDISLSLDPPTTKSTNSGKLLTEASRVNSYDYFPNPEDEATITAEYSEIRKDPGPLARKSSDIDQEEPQVHQNHLDGENKNSIKMPPPVPPKPRSASAMDEPIEMPERRGVLPAQVRPVVAHRPPSPRAAGRATPSIEPDLVGKDRYDKASKCFSYVSAKALNEAFERPRRPSFSRAVERREDEVNRVDPEDIQRVPVQSNDLVRKAEPPKWDDEVEKTKQNALMNELGRLPPRSHSVAAQPYYNRRDDDVEEKPVIFDQAQRAVLTTTPTSTLARNKGKYGSYRTLHDEKYSSVMDDLCDPDFYLNYKTPSTVPQPPPRHAGAKSVELPRKKLKPVESFTDPLDDILNSSGPAPAVSCMELRDRDAFRNRNCRSVAALPSRDRRLFAENYDALSDAHNPDDWLSNKLKKVRSKRDLDPDLVRRRTQEKMLLEELKHAHDENDTRHRHEADYSYEGSGTAVDPLIEYKREEERLRNTYSPFQDLLPRRGRVRGKPPTPPPRDRSRSPGGRSERATPSIDSHYNNPRHQNGNYQDNEDFDFNTLSTIVQPVHRADSARESKSLQRHKSYGAADRPAFAYQEPAQQKSDGSTRFISGQERVAAAIYRAETPQRELYSSGTIYRPDTPTRYFPENSSFAQRSQTPAFPIARETPIPFHPLLYNQNGTGKGDLDRAHTLNNRAASPRSQYGQLSRRSSLTSVDASDIIHHHPVFVKDTSKYWYKPHITREQAINMLRDKHPGTFVVRDSNSFPGAFGLALKVATPPPGVAPGDGTELVRHFLIEPSPKGVKLKGCNNEPVFGSLSALVYQHSITPLALPTRLILPEYDPATTPEHVSATQALLEQGAACNVAYVGSIDVESLTGSECVRRAIVQAVEEAQKEATRPVSVHFKVSSQGVTLTDNTRTVFFRRHFPVNSVTYAGMDPSERRFNNYTVIGFTDSCVPSARMFAFVARKPSSYENSCHVFAELEQEQPASAVVNFINKVMLANRR